MKCDINYDFFWIVEIIISFLITAEFLFRISTYPSVTTVKLPKTKIRNIKRWPLTTDKNKCVLRYKEGIILQ